jgi:hypothetical protein
MSCHTKQQWQEYCKKSEINLIAALGENFSSKQFCANLFRAQGRLRRFLCTVADETLFVADAKTTNTTIDQLLMLWHTHNARFGVYFSTVDAFANELALAQHVLRMLSFTSSDSNEMAARLTNSSTNASTLATSTDATMCRKRRYFDSTIVLTN